MQALKQRLESVILKVNPGARVGDALLTQMDSLQVAFLLDEIEKEFSISFPSSELIFLKQLTLEGLASTVTRLLC
jgi:acyl carrier protein